MKIFPAIWTAMLACLHREHWVCTELITFTHWDEVGMEGKSLLVVIATRRATEGKKNGALLYSAICCFSDNKIRSRHGQEILRLSHKF